MPSRSVPTRSCDRVRDAQQTRLASSCRHSDQGSSRAVFWTSPQALWWSPLRTTFACATPLFVRSTWGFPRLGTNSAGLSKLQISRSKLHVHTRNETTHMSIDPLAQWFRCLNDELLDLFFKVHSSPFRRTRPQRLLHLCLTRQTFTLLVTTNAISVRLHPSNYTDVRARVADPSYLILFRRIDLPNVRALCHRRDPDNLIDLEPFLRERPFFPY